MALYNDIPRLTPLIEAIPLVARVTEGWPYDFNTLPTVALEEASNLPASHSDDREYTTKLGYYFRIFGYDSAEIRAIASAIDDVVVPLGYERVSAYDSNENLVRYKSMTYEMTIRKDW